MPHKQHGLRWVLRASPIASCDRGVGAYHYLTWEGSGSAVCNGVTSKTLTPMDYTCGHYSVPHTSTTTCIDRTAVDPFCPTTTCDISDDSRRAGMVLRSGAAQRVTSPTYGMVRNTVIRAALLFGVTSHTYSTICPSRMRADRARPPVSVSGSVVTVAVSHAPATAARTWKVMATSPGTPSPSAFLFASASHAPVLIPEPGASSAPLGFMLYAHNTTGI